MDTSTLIIIISTSLLSSIFTICLGFILYKVFLRKSLNKQIDEVGDLVKIKMQEGVMESAKELLPDFKEQVSEGFKEALADAISGDVVHRTARNMAKNSSTMVEQGLNLLLGKSQKESESK